MLHSTFEWIFAQIAIVPRSEARSLRMLRCLVEFSRGHVGISWRRPSIGHNPPPSPSDRRYISSRSVIKCHVILEYCKIYLSAANGSNPFRIRLEKGRVLRFAGVERIRRSFKWFLTCVECIIASMIEFWQISVSIFLIVIIYKILSQWFFNIDHLNSVLIGFIFADCCSLKSCRKVFLWNNLD